MIAPPSAGDGIRDAELTDIPGLEALQRRSSLVWEEYRAALLAHPDAIELPEAAVRDRHVRVAIDGGRSLGFTVVLPTTSTVYELDGLFVEPAVMGRGIGRRLVADAVAIARSAGVTRIEVTANPNALGFYEKVGFVAEGATATRFGPGIRMHLILSGDCQPGTGS